MTTKPASAMSHADLHSLASSVYGARWQSQMSRDMGVNLRTVQRWAASGIERLATAEGVRRFLEERRIARIAHPPAGASTSDDRDEACRDALQPAVDALLAAMRDAGWREAECVTALLAASVDAVRQTGGDAAAAALLREAADSLE